MGIQNPDMSRFQMVKIRLVMEWSGFPMVSEIQTKKSRFRMVNHPKSSSVDLKYTHLKSGLIEGWISNGPVSNGRALVMAIAIVPTIGKPDHSKSGRFVHNSNCF